jgi:hypothetical protein
MPKLAKHEVPEAKLDTGAAAIDAALTTAQKQGLFEKPGSTVFAIVELTSVSYTGHADDEGKTPQVKLRVHRAEVARDDEEAASLAEAQRAMYRRRRMDQTFDEVGPGPQGVEDILAADFAGYPTEAQFKEHQDRKRVRDLHNAPR